MKTREADGSIDPYALKTATAAARTLQISFAEAAAGFARIDKILRVGVGDVATWRRLRQGEILIPVPEGERA